MSHFSTPTPILYIGYFFRGDPKESKPLPIGTVPLEAAKDSLAEALLDRWMAGVTYRRGNAVKPPHAAHLVDQDGKVHYALQVRGDGYLYEVPLEGDGLGNRLRRVDE